MTSMSWKGATRRWSMWVAFFAALMLTMLMATAAFAILDEFGGASYTAPYAPYTAGPVVAELEEYAPYTAGPVVREEFRPYAPYTAGPVVREEPRPYAPYTAGPVVPEEDVPERIGNYLLK
jgi:hypothetical protein